jgi:hypothetical protein
MKLELIFLTILINLTKQRNLIFVLTHFRHGARAPIAPSDDPYDYFNKSWNNPSQLTGVGNRMHYILGLHNRERYIMNEDTKLLDESCNLHDILIMSTNFNRTINSALAQLYGLYPEETKQITEKMGGQISLTSELNKGTVFELKFPVYNEEEALKCSQKS